VAPDPLPDVPAGKWHKVLVRVEGSRYQVTVNQTRVVNAVLNRSEKSGHIGLQMNRTVVEFRNVRVLDLAP
jgi:hypothetical protein